MLAFDLEGRHCSFCGESATSADGPGLKSGFGALICASCVDGYHAASARTADTDHIVDPWADESVPDLLAKLQLIVSTKRQVDDFLQAYVHMLRERRLSWASIGGALGVSRQAAWERFSRPRD